MVRSLIREVRIEPLLIGFLVSTVFICSTPWAIPAPDDPADPMLPVAFVVIKSTKSYEDALKTVEAASDRIGIRIDLRDVIYDPKFGLTFSKRRLAEGEDEQNAYPWYFPRGRSDHGVYLSVERSDSYKSFAAGFYVVIAASGEVGSEPIRETLARVKGSYPDAYVKVAKVYYGCMH